MSFGGWGNSTWSLIRISSVIHIHASWYDGNSAPFAAASESWHSVDHWSQVCTIALIASILQMLHTHWHKINSVHHASSQYRLPIETFIMMYAIYIWFTFVGNNVGCSNYCFGYINSSPPACRPGRPSLFIPNKLLHNQFLRTSITYGVCRLS